MTVSKGDVQALTWIATRLREDTHGCARWDAQGTYAVISELVGQNLAETLHRVVGHALDPEARTPGAIRRPFIPKRIDEPGARRQPAKAGEDCKRHPGEYVGSCRACAVELLTSEHDVVLEDDDRTAGRALVAAIRARRLGLLGSSPAHGVAAPSEPPAPPAPRADEGDDHGPASAGEPDDRPETTCAAEGCYRPTRDGICDRCRAKAIRDDEQAANARLIAQLEDNERRRAASRPEPNPEPPRRFTSADIDHDRVRAAMTRAAEQRSNA